MRHDPEPTSDERNARAEYALRQAELVRALVTRSDPPAGFDPERARQLVDTLLRKRRRAVARVWPALAHNLGRSFEAAFDEYAASSPPRHQPDPVADGLAFACSLDARRLDDAARRELVLARTRWVFGSGRTRRRRLPCVTVTRMGPGWPLVGVHVPGFEPRCLRFGRGSRRAGDPAPH